MLERCLNFPLNNTDTLASLFCVEMQLDIKAVFNLIKLETIKEPRGVTL